MSFQDWARLVDAGDPGGVQGAQAQQAVPQLGGAQLPHLLPLHLRHILHQQRPQRRAPGGPTPHPSAWHTRPAQ